MHSLLDPLISFTRQHLVFVRYSSLQSIRTIATAKLVTQHDTDERRERWISKNSNDSKVCKNWFYRSILFFSTWSLFRHLKALFSLIWCFSFVQRFCFETENSAILAVTCINRSIELVPNKRVKQLLINTENEFCAQCFKTHEKTYAVRIEMDCMHRTIENEYQR